MLGVLGGGAFKLGSEDVTCRSRQGVSIRQGGGERTRGRGNGEVGGLSMRWCTGVGA